MVTFPSPMTLRQKVQRFRGTPTGHPLTVVFCLLFFCTYGQVYAANKPEKIVSSGGPLLSSKKPPSKNYDSCRKELVKKIKNGSLNKFKFTQELNACRENYPASVVYASCKKQLLKKSKNKKTPPNMLQECRDLQKVLEFAPDNPAPFLVEQGQLYFAGIGINRSQPTSQINPPNFVCTRLQNASKSIASAQYLLFGNHPSTFRGFKNKSPDDILSALGEGLRPSGSAGGKKARNRSTRESGLDYVGFGRIYDKPTSSKALTFFPVAACDFNSETGPQFGALSTYYLIDALAASVTPLFGIAYFKENQTMFTTNDVEEALKKQLGNEFNIIKKNDSTSFLAISIPEEFDEEGDPKNLCKEPRNHKFFGIVQGQKSKANRPDFVLLASVKNLCDFGDRLSLRLTK
jgi:hypothetical protein